MFVLPSQFFPAAFGCFPHEDLLQVLVDYLYSIISTQEQLQVWFVKLAQYPDGAKRVAAGVCGQMLYKSRPKNEGRWGSKID